MLLLGFEQGRGRLWPPLGIHRRIARPAQLLHLLDGNADGDGMGYPCGIGRKYPPHSGLYAMLNGSRSQESSHKVLKLSHLYLLDHLIQTLYTLGFARHYWYEVPHDGRRVVNSRAQEDLIRLAVSRGEVSDTMPDNIAEIARGLWEKEEGTARVVLFLAWLIKVSSRCFDSSRPRD
jgi:hypothetical protein